MYECMYLNVSKYERWQNVLLNQSLFQKEQMNEWITYTVNEVGKNGKDR